jgi:23S rRNA pseudouridine2605 synthase
VPKKTNGKAAAATASADKVLPAKLEIILETEPELKPKAKKTPAKKPDAASALPAKSPKKPVESAPEPAAVSAEAAPEPATPPAKKRRASIKTHPAKASAAKTAKVKIKNEAGAAVEVTVPAGAPVADPIGDVSDPEAHAAETKADSITASESQELAATLAEEINSNEEPEYFPETPHAAGTAPPEKLERLQKILAKAGIASRRRAEEMIVEGRVIVNGQVVTQLGAKADLGRDHIRVDGKLLGGAEHHRYFVLNKPRGFVTTVSDPEGRPTVMQFFAKMPQRLYPVGRLDYLSEGLLLVTNDGELANQLTRASLGVEKTYLVKVAGKPTEEELDRLRSGVLIEREGPGSKRVGTAPAAVRQVRQGDNPWYEVVLIEGRNRELRKMFEQIGHFVEKIRRVAYGPLVLDVEPGEFRELSAEEVKSLQLTAEGKLKPRRTKALPTVPKDAIRRAGDRPARGGSGRTFQSRPPAGSTGRPPSGSAGRTFDGPPRGRTPESRPAFDSRRPERGAKPGFKPRFDKPRFNNRNSERYGGRAQFSNSEGEQLGGSRPLERRPSSSKPFRGREEFPSERPQRFEERNTGFRPQQRGQETEGGSAPQREFGPRGDRPQFNRGGKPAFKRSSPGAPERGGRSSYGGGRPAFDRGAKPPFERGSKPPFKKGERPEFKRSAPGAPLREGQSSFKGERSSFDRSGGPAHDSKPGFDRSSRPGFDRGGKPPFERGARPAFKRDERPPVRREGPLFPRSGEAGSNFEGRPSRPPGRTFGARPAGRPSGGRSPGGRSSGGAASGRKFGSGAPRKPGSRPGGKFKPRSGDRKRY